ncbi:hypothetical protein EDD18DRAFT_1343966 [Armillaria luteobubalina]|uniref:Chromatin elongation factor spt5 n=1 Tax=Armillaria luteobubalina TaxID=153913 RepID=A0AA39QNP3_9AGAR|nr:hypothetical protein EDD18DRAFT_1343966 [Armillaria luteobubalina]
MAPDKRKEEPPLRHRYVRVRYELDSSGKTIHMRSSKDATGALHLTFEENPILDNKSDQRTANRQTGTSHTGGNAAFPEEAKWRVIKTRATPLPELVITGPTTVPWPSSKHHRPGNTIWFNSESPEDITSSGHINPMPDVGTVYIHHNMVTGLLQIWVLQVDRTWGVLSSFHRHIVHPDPQHHDRYFQLSKDMKPSWVTDATKARYDKESEKKAGRQQSAYNEEIYVPFPNWGLWFVELYLAILSESFIVILSWPGLTFTRLSHSMFLDIEAGISQDDEVDSPYEDDDHENFIVEEDDWDDTAHSMTSKVSDRVATPSVVDESQDWNNFLDRARSRANVPSTLESDVQFDNGLFDVAPELWSGWEESVVMHIGRCAWPELGIKAAFIIPLVEEKVWLEASISSSLKDWLVEIPGVIHRNQQVMLHAISLEDSRRTLSMTVKNPFMPGCWVKVRHGRSKGEVGIVSKMYPWGCKVLLAPKLDLPHDRDKQHPSSQSEPKLFNVTAIEKAGYHVLKEGPLNYRFRGFMYDHDLLACRIYFSQIEIAGEIPDKLACLFAQLGHPLVCKSLQSLPRVSKWCFQVGEVITDISRRVSGTIHGVGEHGLEVEFAGGLFPVRWAHCKKEFEIGTYVEITGEERATRWSGWVHAVDSELLHLISRSGPDNEQIEIRGVHPNSVSAVSPPNNTSVPLDREFQRLDSVSIVPWKGVMVQVIKRGHHWHGKTGYVVDVNIVKNPDEKKEILSLLVQLSHYDPNAPFVSLWFRYLDVVDEESWLPLNEARPIVNDTDFFRNLVPDTNVLGKRGRRPPRPEPAVRPRSLTPLPDPTERCLSPAWNPSSLDPPPFKYWCLDHRLLGARFRVQYNNLKITALVKYDCSLEKVVCTRDDTPLGTTLDPARVLAIHPKIRHYNMFLVISGEHCGKWARSIRFHKRSPTDSLDLDWTVVVVIPRAPFMHDDVTDETLVLHSSMMTIADETKISRQLNLDLRKRLREGPQSH